MKNMYSWNWGQLFHRISDVKNENALARSAMAKRRFLALSNRLRFDDKASLSERRKRDEFAPIGDLWEVLLSNLKRYYMPGPFITVDES